MMERHLLYRAWHFYGMRTASLCESLEEPEYRLNCCPSEVGNLPQWVRGRGRSGRRTLERLRRRRVLNRQWLFG